MRAPCGEFHMLDWLTVPDLERAPELAALITDAALDVLDVGLVADHANHAARRATIRD